MGVVVLIGLTIHLATQRLGLCDVFWQVRAGDEMLASRAVPAVESYSYTATGTPWNNHEWGFELVVAWIHRVAGWQGIRALVLPLFGGVLAWFVAREVRSRGPASAFLVGTLFLVLAHYKRLPAPQLISMLYFLLALRLIEHRDWARSAWQAGALMALLVIWANSTAEVVIVLPFLVVDQVVRACEPDHGSHTIRAAVHVLVLLAPALTPSGSSVFEYAFHGSLVNSTVNAEFARLWEPAMSIPSLCKQVARVLAVVTTGWALGKLRGCRARGQDARRAGFALLAVTAAVLFERNVWLLMVPVSFMLEELAERFARTPLRMHFGAGLLATLLLVAYLHAIPWKLARAATTLTSSGYWTTAINDRVVPVPCGDALAALPVGTRVFAPRVWASYVLWRAPQVRVFIDGRNREYSLALHQASLHVAEARIDALDILAQWGTQRVLAGPDWGESPRIRAGGWHPVLRSTHCALYAR